jgi:hypothetical protein
VNERSTSTGADEISFKNGVQVRFPHPVAQMVSIENVVVVRLDIPESSVMNENVFAFSQDGQRLWQVPKQPYVHSDSPYTHVWTESGDLFLQSWDGFRIQVDPTSGVVLRFEETR